MVRLICWLFVQLYALGLVTASEPIPDRIRAIDPRTGTLTLNKGRPFITYHFRDTVEVTINGQRAKIAQLVPGLMVRVVSHEPGVANYIHATGLVETKIIPHSTSVGLVNLNYATREELDEIPGVGPVLAEAIIAARPFKSVEELLRVRGIAEKTLEKLRPFVKVD